MVSRKKSDKEPGECSGIFRFRSHSPSSRQKSREKDRRDLSTGHRSDPGAVLMYNEIIRAGMSGSLEDSRHSDDCDGNGSGPRSSEQRKKYRHERTYSAQEIDRLNTKIQCAKESIRREQTARDDNVNEYLMLSASADKQQLQRIKAVFEKKNQKSAHSISQLQKKLENYTRRVQDLQNHQYNSRTQHRQPREVLRDVGLGLRNVGGNIRDGITGFSGSVMSKPREFAHLIKNKFGSADNINEMGDTDLSTLNTSAHQCDHSHICGTSTPNNTATTINTQAASTSSGNTGGAGSGKFNSENCSECSSVTSGSAPPGNSRPDPDDRVMEDDGFDYKEIFAQSSGKSQSAASHLMWKTLITELQERKDDIDTLRGRIERLETSQKEYQDLTVTLESERYRAERLEEQINDLTELHQNEIINLKQTIADLEEKIQYQSDERLRDINEVLENCQTRITKIEHLSQQQYVTVEGIDNSNARALVVKLINIVLTILQVILLLVATAAGIIMPFLKTRVRVLTTGFSIFVVIFVIRQWPELRDIGAHLIRHLKESLVVK